MRRLGRRIIHALEQAAPVRHARCAAKRDHQHAVALHRHVDKLVCEIPSKECFTAMGKLSLFYNTLVPSSAVIRIRLGCSPAWSLK